LLETEKKLQLSLVSIVKKLDKMRKTALKRFATVIWKDFTGERSMSLLISKTTVGPIKTTGVTLSFTGWKLMAGCRRSVKILLRGYYIFITTTICPCAML
jgi:hypothetical protein